MSAAFIAPLAEIREPSLAASVPLAAATTPAVGPTFGNLVSDGLAQVDAQLKTNRTDLQQLARGDVENLHQIMIRMEEARLSFQLMMQVRNRLLESYQEVMRMQV